MCCPLVFEFSVGIGGFVIGLGQISFFFSSIFIKALNLIKVPTGANYMAIGLKYNISLICKKRRIVIRRPPKEACR